MAKKLLFGLLAILVVAAVIYSPLFNVKTVVLNQKSPCVDKKDTENLTGQRIYLINAKKTEEKIKKEHACVESLTVSKSYPSKITIEVKTTGAVAKIEGTSFGLTESGQIVAIGTTSLPTIFSSKLQATSSGQQVTDGDILLAAKVASALTKSDFATASIRIVDDGIAVYGVENILALFARDKDIQKQADSLQQVMARAKIDASKISKIDLRFDKPIIVYK